MKITDSEIIKNGEQELIDAITADLDWGAIEEVFLKEHNLGIEEDIEYKSGDIVAVDNQIAYKLEFEVKVNLSVLLNRDGEYLSVTISNQKEKVEEEEGDINIDDESATPDADIEPAMNIEESSTVNNNSDSAVEQDNDSSVVSDEANNINNEETEDIEDIEDIVSEEPDVAPFGDLSDSNTDDMGQKAEDILENIKKAG